MKPGIHPEYRYVVFKDTSSGDTFLTRSTIETSETIQWEDGNTYPLAKVEISAFTHPFFTGQMKIVDTAGRVERFERRYGKRRKSSAGAGADDASAAETDDPRTDDAE
jgi:large subunit ribosomal protein L31